MEKAVAAAKSAHSLDPLSIEPLEAWAAAEESRGRIPRARELYVQAVKLQPLNSIAWYELGRFDQEVVGDDAAATRELMRAIELDPRLPGSAGTRSGMRGLRRRAEFGRAAAAAGLSGLFGILVLHSWRGDLGVPYSYSGDANQHDGFIKAVLDHGWYWHNPNLGAPGGQQLFDFPVLNGDTLNVLLWKVLGAFGLDAPAVLNVFFLATFFLVGLSAYLVLRRLTVSWPVAIVCSTLYALLPYHFYRGEDHLLLSAYYAVPLGAYLVLAVLGDEPLFARRGGRGLLSWASRRTLVTLGLCAVIALASGSFYYAVFTVVLVAAAALLRAVAGRSVRPLWEGGAVVAVIAVLSLVSLAPTLAYRARHGTNQQVAHRESFESELYGLKLAQLVLPIEQHRIGKLASLRQRYDAWSTPTEATLGAPLGLVGTVGLVWLLAVSVLQLASPGRRVAPARDGQAGTAVIVALFFAWTGGLATLVAAIEPQIRAWNRLSIFIGFFALLAVGLLLDRGLARLRTRPVGGPVGGGRALSGAGDRGSRSDERQIGSSVSDGRCRLAKRPGVRARDRRAAARGRAGLPAPVRGSFPRRRR